MMKKFVERISKIKDKYKKHASVAIAVLILLLFFGAKIKPLVVGILFILIAAFSTFYHNYFRSPINFELIKMATILTAVAYGAVFGVIVGILSVIIGRALSGRLDQDTITSLGAISIIAVVGSMLSTANITVLGISLVVLYYILISPFIFLFGENRAREAVYIGTNLFFNTILFVNVAPWLLEIIKK